MIIAVLDLSRIVATTPDLPAREAWKIACRWVRAFASENGYHYDGEWYRTRNRIGYACGKYRATPMLADRREERAS